MEVTPFQSEHGASKTTDPAGRVIRVERWSGISLAKGSQGGIVTLGSPSGADLVYTNVVSTNGTLASFTRTVYDWNNRAVWTVDALGTVTTNVYDAAGRRTSVMVYTNYSVDMTSVSSSIAPTGGVMETDYAYDANGNQVAVTDALGRRTDYVYDAADRLIQTIYPLVSGDAARKTVQTWYDGLGRRIAQRDEAGVVTAFTNDFRGLLTAVTLDATNVAPLVTTYAYDEFGNETSQTDANTNVTLFSYDTLGRRTSRTLPDGTSTETTVYSDVLEPGGSGVKVAAQTLTDFRGLVTTVTNDRMDRAWFKLLPGVNSGETTTLVAYAYDTNGLLDHVAMSGQIVRTNYYAYDSLRRLRKKDTPEGVLTYTYTNNGSVLSIQGFRRTSVGTNAEVGAATPDVSLGYLYDRLGRLASATDWGTNTTSYAYDPVGNLGKFVYPNSVTNSYYYTEQNRLKTMTLTNLAGVQLRRYDYSLSAQGWRTNITESTNGTQLRRAFYRYDRDDTGATTPAQVGRLTQETLFNSANTLQGGITNLYDAVGNRASRLMKLSFTPIDLPLQTNQSLAFDVNDRISGSPWSYDTNGNTLSDTAGASTNYYDGENHLTKQAPAGAGITNTFDFEGRRVAKKVGTASIFYLIDDRNPSGWPQVLAEYSSVTANVAPNVAYAYGLALISERLPGSGGPYTNKFYGFDGQGSVRLLMGPTTSATVTDTFDFGAYGLLLARSGITTNNYLYGCQQWDPDWGMYYLRARFYRPNEGRFWGMDTFHGNNQDPQSLHKYLYASGNPGNRVDPSGTDYTLGTALTVGAICGTLSALDSYVSSRGQAKATDLAASFFVGGAIGALSGGIGSILWEFGLGGRIAVSGIALSFGIAGIGEAVEQGNPDLVLMRGASLGVGMLAIAKGWPVSRSTTVIGDIGEARARRCCIIRHAVGIFL